MSYIAQGAASTSDMAAQAKPALARRKKRPRHVSPAVRAKTAVIHQGGKAKFPIPDAAHARAALGRVNQAKPPLTAAQKDLVRRKARKVLSKNATAGDGRLERAAPRFAAAEHGADAMGPFDAGGAQGDVRLTRMRTSEMNRRTFGSRQRRRLTTTTYQPRNY